MKKEVLCVILILSSFVIVVLSCLLVLTGLLFTFADTDFFRPDFMLGSMSNVVRWYLEGGVSLIPDLAPALVLQITVVTGYLLYMGDKVVQRSSHYETAILVSSIANLIIFAGSLLAVGAMESGASLGRIIKLFTIAAIQMSALIAIVYNYGFQILDWICESMRWLVRMVYPKPRLAVK